MVTYPSPSTREPVIKLGSHQRRDEVATEADEKAGHLVTFYHTLHQRLADGVAVGKDGGYASNVDVLGYSGNIGHKQLKCLTRKSFKS